MIGPDAVQPKGRAGGMMREKAVSIEIVRDLDRVPGWIDMQRDYLDYAIERHRVISGQTVDAVDQLCQTVAHIGDVLGPGGRFLAAFDEKDRLVGMVLLYRLTNGKGEVKRLFVRPDARRMGVAQKLMRRLEAEAVAMGCTALYLDTSAGLDAAIRFYEKLGFAGTAFDAASQQDPEIAKHLVIMEKPLVS